MDVRVVICTVNVTSGVGRIEVCKMQYGSSGNGQGTSGASERCKS